MAFRTADGRWLAFGIVSLGAAGLIVWLGRDLTFAHDECVFLARDLSAPLAPHNEHWSTIPLILWKATEAAFGTANYLPFLAILMVAQVAIAAGMYTALGKGVLALAVVALLLFLGSGSDNVLWAFQIGFVVSIAAGVWAIIIVERRRYALAALLLVVAVSSSGMGLPFVVATSVMGAIQRERSALWLVVPAAVYLAWLIAFGTSGLVSHANPLDHADRVPRIVGQQVVDSLGALFGLPGPAVLAALMAVGAYMMWRGWRPTAVVVGAVVGIAAMFAIIGLVRDEGFASRYQTGFAVFTLLIVGRVPWPSHRYLVTAGLLLFSWALLVNVGGLLRYGFEYEYFLALGYGC